jgi:hypothetical protein
MRRIATDRDPLMAAGKARLVRALSSGRQKKDRYR